MLCAFKSGNYNPIFLLHLCMQPLSSECEWYQIPRQERPPHTDSCEETLQVSLWQKLQDLAGLEAPHHQLPPARLHRDPPQDSRLRACAHTNQLPLKKKRVLTFLTHPMYTKGSSACFKVFFLFFFKSSSFCVTLVFFSIYVISLVFFWETKKKTIFVVFLLMYICTFVYAITLFYFLSFDLHKVLTVKKKNNRKKRQKTKWYESKEEKRRRCETGSATKPCLPPAQLWVGWSWPPVLM